MLNELKARLGLQYTPGTGGQGGHDISHVLRMCRMYHELSTLIPGVDQHIYEVTVWLHNADRYEELMPHRDSLEQSLYALLRGVEFRGATESNRRDIINAVKEHGKYKDDPNDSKLLQMLRLADKWDRIGYTGAVSGFAWLGNKLPAYNPEKPFSYGSTAEGSYTNLYQNLFRIMEWYADFPHIRELCRRHPWRFANFLAFVRGFAAEIADAHGVTNEVENDIMKCLKEHYSEWRPA